ncbi:hypothetical protein [Streptomyces acidiscabies]|uniref:hypothetical protein n=1 Tax=Streptomyces acidiscabies TaxID=42234 RepID=UPI0011473C90|nr:hypothetical protein [Streptomyces acidiscabies]MBP5938731.1 hypothetical protein [Streptomyces sp. LBUM 1476]MBZ3909842.1 hypothetical protein [Streptomyces acidiscabies]
MPNLNEHPTTAEDLLPLALTSYGHFTSMRVDADRRIRGLSLHMERLVRDSRIVFDAPVDTGHVRELVSKALDGRDRPCVVRVTHFDPAVDMGHPKEAVQPQISATPHVRSLAEPVRGSGPTGALLTRAEESHLPSPQLGKLGSPGDSYRS